MQEDVVLLERFGWVVECESPLEIRHVDGAFVRGAHEVVCILEQCREETLKEACKKDVPTFHWMPKPETMNGMRLDDPKCQKELGRWLEKMARDGYSCVFFNANGDTLFRKDL